MKSTTAVDDQYEPDYKTCRHCDITFRRHYSAHIPNDRCARCHEEIEAMGMDADDEVAIPYEVPELDKQPRYQDAKGGDWIDEFARTATLDEFRGAMRFTIGKYNRRVGRKDEVLSEVRKMRDYCQRWEAYEEGLK